MYPTFNDYALYIACVYCRYLNNRKQISIYTNVSFNINKEELYYLNMNVRKAYLKAK